MGMFAETANVDYRLSFADQGKQTVVFRFRFQLTMGHLSFPFGANKWKLAFSISSVCQIPGSQRHG
jgi:hypothetical protein